MAVLTLNDDQILALVRQLSKESRDWLFNQLLSEQWPQWAELAGYGRERARTLAASRGRNWDQMSEAEQEQFIDEVVHEAD